MAQEMSLFTSNAQLPAHLQGINLGITTQLKQGMFSGGNRIGLRNSRFRLIVAGIEEGIIEENYLDVIFLSAAPAVSRVYYKDAYKQGENTPPVCFSADGIVPHTDVKNKQSDKCATCPMNVKGSKVSDGQKYKACGYFRRVVVMLAGDVEAKRVFKLDVKGQGIFGDSSANAKSLNDYIKALDTRGVDAGQVVTRIKFDLDASVPKLLFSPQRYIDSDELDVVQDLIVSDEVKNMSEVSMSTVDNSNEDGGEPEAGEETPQETQQAAAQPQRTTQAVQGQRPASQAPQRPAQTAQRPAQTQAVDVEEIAIEEVSVQTQKPAPQRTQQTVQRTVQGAAPQRPQQTAQATQAAAQQTAQVQEVASDDELGAILDGLDL